MSQLPHGIVTFLFTDIQGSTRLFQRYPETMPAALARHNAILHQVIRGRGGHVFQVIGDSFCAAFAQAPAALHAALEAQRLLHSEPWAEIEALQVRMGLHTGPAETRGEDYVSSLTLVRVQRVMSVGHGGQTLLSSAAAAAVGAELPPGTALRHLGDYRLRGLAQPEPMYQHIAPGLPQTFPPLQATLVEADAAPASPLAQLTRERLVGRHQELAALKRHWQGALQAQGHLVTLSGEPGVGKTRLAGELIDFAQAAGATVLRGGCYEYEAATPYLPFVEALQGWVRMQTAADLRQHLGATAPEIARFAPEIESKIGPLAPSPPLPPHEERLRLYDSVTRLLDTLARPSGLLLFLDDLHWADQGTLTLLHHILRRLQGDRVLFLAAYREVELDRKHPLAAALVDWNRERLATRLALGRLSRPDTSALLAALFGGQEAAPEFADVIFAETEGNPFFIEEVVKSLIEQEQVYYQEGRWQRKEIAELAIPQSVKEAIGRRLSRLSESCLAMLHTAAVLGKQFRFQELSLAADVDEDTLLDALDEASAAQLLRTDAHDRFAFTHDKIREVLYEEINPIRRRRLHHRIGESLEHLHTPSGTPGLSQELAYHFVHSGDLERALKYSLLAAQHALRLFALDEAISLYVQAQEAAEALNRQDDLMHILEQLGEVYWLKGARPEAVASYTRALELAAEPEQQAALKTRIGSVYALVGDLSGLPFLHEALTGLNPETQANTLAHAQALLGRYHHYRAEHRQALVYLHKARELAEPLDDPFILLAIYAYLAGAYQHLGEYEESNRWARMNIALGERRQHPFAMAVGYEFLSENAFQRGHWPEALACASRNRRFGEQSGAQDRIAWAEYARACSLYGQGDLQLARTAASAALELSQRSAETRLATWCEPMLAVICADQGDDVAARRYAESGGHRGEALAQMALLCWSLHGRGYYHLMRGEWGLAYDYYHDAWSRLRPTESRVALSICGAYAALAVLVSGRRAEAAEIIQYFVQAMRESGVQHALGLGWRVQAQVHMAQEEWEQARQQLDASLRLLEALGSRLEWSRTLYQSAVLQSQSGENDLAIANATRAAAAFRDMGALRDLEQADLLLHTLTQP